MTLNNRQRRQRGLTLIGFVIIVALVGAAGIVAFRAIPIYSEFFTIKRIIKQINVDNPDTTPQQIRSQFDLKSSADYVYDIKSRDLDIAKENGRIVISVRYQKTVPLVHNISLLFDFETDNRK
jgi:cell division protein FtsL